MKFNAFFAVGIAYILMCVAIFIPHFGETVEYSNQIVTFFTLLKVALLIGCPFALGILSKIEF